MFKDETSKLSSRKGKRHLAVVGILLKNKLFDDSFQISMIRKREIKKGESKGVFYTFPSDSSSY
jgi:hypothetical protein